ncbi:hypothetical protein [Halomicrobium katesii]|uniref:hypothetical protein n=1 Tax=Halomicrobium katesii TaxID=437163 RepID=UPI0012BAFE06|nr:hypothetical protein [Halomicrobium katesii]
MSRFKLKPYEIRLRKSGNTTDYLDLTSLVESGAAFEEAFFVDSHSSPLHLTELFEQYATHWYNNPVNDQGRQRTLSVDDDPENGGGYFRPTQGSAGGTLEGVLKYGVYGTSADHLDTDTGNREEDARRAEEAAETPIPFLLHVPDNDPRRAVIVLEAVGTAGIKSLLAQEFETLLPDGLMLEFEPVKDEAIYSRIRHADEVTRARLRKSGRLNERNDRFTSIFGDSLCKQSSIYEPFEGGSIDVDVGELEDWIENADDDENPFDIGGEVFDQVRLTIKEAGSESTLLLKEGERVS